MRLLAMRSSLPLLLLALCWLPGSLLAAENRLALVIGNSEYADSPLSNPKNDAADMAEALRSLGFTVMLHQDVDRRAMARAIREFGRELREQRGIGLFYYAGHGMQIDNHNYLIPVDSPVEEEDEIPYESIDVGSVLAKMESAGNALNLLILDACRNNPFPSQFRSSHRGLARVEAPIGSLVVYSTAPGRVAADGDGRNGVFTGALLEQLRTPGLSLTQTIRRTRASVVRATEGRQVPWESSSLLQDYYLGAAPGTEPLSSRTAEQGPALASSARKGVQLATIGSEPTSKPETSRLTVTAFPEAARIRIMNIVEKYRPGITLTRDRSYDIYVTHPGFESYRQQVELDPETHELQVELHRRSALTPATIALTGGEFTMGCSSRDRQCESYEKPSHEVTVPPFSIGRTEVTVAQFARFVEATGYRTDAENNAGGYSGCYIWHDGGGISRASARWEWVEGRHWRNPGYEQQQDFPVSCVSWNDAMAYADWLSQQEGRHFTLPTEAQWEYAARAGRNEGVHTADVATRSLCQYANLADNSQSPTGSRWSSRIDCHDGHWFAAPVASFSPNVLGLHDMQGNVWEWVQDNWRGDFKATPIDGSAFTDHATNEHVVRGGAWESDASRIRLSSRGKAGKASRTAMTGFRLVVDQ